MLLQKKMNAPSRTCVSICGGLGNQMFQYALGCALEKRLHVPIAYDLTWFSHMSGCTPRKFLLGEFPEIAKSFCVATEKERNTLLYGGTTFWSRICDALLRRVRRFGPAFVQEPSAAYWEGIWNIQCPAYVQGFWQSSQYFEHVESTIRQAFTFPSLPENSCPMADEISRLENSIAVHVRRGDYAHNAVTNAVHGLCSSAYYAKAIEHIQSFAHDAHLYIFSDEPAWVRGNFDSHGLPFTVVDIHSENEAHHDMHLMSLCRHFIIANSSFSWWGAWLSQRDGVICAPEDWFVSDNAIDLPPGWLKF